MRMTAITVLASASLTLAAVFVFHIAPPFGKVVGQLVTIQKESAEAAVQRKTTDACHREVLKQLKAPGSARWAGDKASLDEDGYYEVKGAVDAQNPFGALMRLKYVCGQNQAHDGIFAFVWQTS